MASSFPKSIKFQLLLIVLIISIPAIGIILYSGVQFRNAAIDGARRDTQKLADRIATEHQNLVICGEQLIIALAQLPEVKRQDKAKVEPILQKLKAMNPMYSNIFISDKNGLVWASAAQTKQAFSVADRSYFKKALTSGELSSGEYVMSRATSKPVLNFARSFKDDHGNVIGTICFGFLLDKYRDLITQMELPEHASFVLCDHKGIVLTRAINPEKFVGKPYELHLFQQFQNEPDGNTTIRPGIAGDKRIITLRKLRLASEQSPYMYITMGIPLEVALQPANWALLKNMTMFMSFLGVALFLAWLICKYMITDRIELLEKTAQQLANGDFKSRVAELISGGELGSLGQSFDNMTDKLAARELALIESQERLRNLVANAPVVLFALDLNGRFTFFEGKVMTALGLTPTQVVGQSFFEIFSESPAALEGARRALAGETFTSTTAIKDHYFEIWYNPINNDQGERTGTIGVVNDLTEHERSEVERQKLEAQLQQAQKMESVGRLAGGVAHDFNNQLSVILGYSELSLLEIDPSQPHYAAFLEIKKAAERSATLTGQLLAFARKQTVSPIVIDLNETVSGMLKMLQRLIGENIQLAWHPASNIWPIKIDPSQIDQLLANLCVNARDAIKDIGRICIETGNCTIDETYCATHADTIPGEYLKITVSDDGCGMDKETLSHIFEPFYTTKELGKGTGLGLATLFGIVMQNNGFINVYSEPGQGTTFTIYLPRHIGENEEVSKVIASELPSKGNETILLVEDEPTILEMAALMLKGLGYTVVTAGTGNEAIRLFKERADSIQLLMTDVVMPDMNGRNLQKELQLLSPQLKCLFMSGYTANVIAHHGVLDEGVHFINKPFSVLDLAQKVRVVLAGK
jgi:PAS domain S-box-containing protein